MAEHCQNNVVPMHDELERGREHYRRRAWADAFEALSLADRYVTLAGDDLELRGYLLLPSVQAHMASRNYDAAYVDAEHAARIGDHCADPDLSACARYLQGAA